MAQLWNRSETELLIELLKQNPVIYDSSHQDYNKPNVRKAAYKKMLSYFKMRPDFTVAVLKKKIKTLRTQLNTEMKKMNAVCGAGSDDAYTPTLWCFDKIKFLLNVHNDSESAANVDVSMTQELCDEQNLSDMLILQSQAYSSSSQASSTRSPKRKKSYESNKMLKDPLQVAVANMRSSSIIGNKSSSKAELFCNYMCSQLEELSATSFDSVSHKIMGLILEAKEKESYKRPRKTATRKSPSPTNSWPKLYCQSDASEEEANSAPIQKD